MSKVVSIQKNVSNNEFLDAYLASSTAPNARAKEYATKRGLTQKQIKQAGLRSVAADYWRYGEGILIPYADLYGKTIAGYGRIRNLDVDEPKFWQPSGSRNYWYPAFGFDWKKVAADTRITLGFTEGEFKAIAAARHSIPVIGIGGIWNWRTKIKRGDKEKTVPLPEFELINWEGRRVELWPDCDATANHNVGLAVVQLGAFLQSLGADVFVCQIPDMGDGKTGLDDFLVAKGLKHVNDLRTNAAPLDDARFHRLGIPNERYKYTDSSVAEHFVLDHGHRVRYVALQNRWMRYEVDQWRPDDSTHRENLVVETARRLQHDATKMKDSAARSHGFTKACGLEEAPRIKRILSRVRTNPIISTTHTQWDADPDLLGVANGIVHLPSGNLLPPDPAHLVSRYSPVSYEQRASAPKRWLRLLNEAMCGDSELVTYLQRVLGYCLTGHTSEQAIFLAWGYGNNCKSTVINVIEPIFGQYAANIQAESLFIRDRHGGNAANSDVARLPGIRFVRAVETNIGRSLDEALIKQITGQDVVTARFLYSEWFEFRPQFKVVLVCNHLPRIHGADPAIKRRIHVIPFRYQVAKPKKDYHLAFADERPAILKWMVDGAGDWYRTRLCDPEAVKRATAGYLTANDAIFQFLEKECEIVPTSRVKRSMLYESYRSWAIVGSVKGEISAGPYPKNLFFEMLRERGYKDKKYRGEMFFFGLRLHSGEGL